MATRVLLSGEMRYLEEAVAPVSKLALNFAKSALAVGFGSALLVGCSAPPEISQVQTSALEGGVVAQVGALDVRAETVAQIAADQRLSIDEARKRTIRDALFGLGAENESLRGSAEVRAAIRARLARTMLADIGAQTAEAPPTDEEVAAKTADHFLDLDRPEGFRVIHAVARISATSDEAAKKRARQLADQVAKAVGGAADAKEFETRAKTVSAEGIEFRIELLDPVAADGRVLTPKGGELVEPFATAASRLAYVGEQSPVIETEFGFHVMQLLEKTPEKRVSLEQRRAMLKDEILAIRAREASAATVERLRKERTIEIERSADALMQSLQVLTP